MTEKISKENVIRAQNEIRGIATEGSFLHAGPSEYISNYGDIPSVRKAIDLINTDCKLKNKLSLYLIEELYLLLYL